MGIESEGEFETRTEKYKFIHILRINVIINLNN